MVLTIDIGNSNIVIGEWDGDKLIFVSRVETDKTMTEDSYAVRFKNILEMYEVQYEKIEGSIISSVVPQVTEAVVNAVARLTGKKPLILGPGIKTGLNIRIEDPAKLGSDLVADAVAALAKYPKPIIVFDMGTATTVGVIDADGNYLGGAIMPGVRTGFDALTRNASLLPTIAFDAPRDIIGKNTSECMQSGVTYGTACMIDGIAERIQERLSQKGPAIAISGNTSGRMKTGAAYGTACMIDGMAGRIEEKISQKATIVATGGLSKDIVPYCRSGVIYDGNLLLEGLIQIYHKNKTVY